MSAIAVLGAGSWGTALAVHLARTGHHVELWARREDDPDAMQERRENSRYLAGVALPDGVHVTGDLARIEDATLVIGAVPSSATAQVARLAAPHVAATVTWISATKGLEPGSHRRISEVVEELLPGPVAVLSGPSFAREVAAGQPTAVVVACRDLEIARAVQREVSSPKFRAYASSDVIGVELGGAFKNVIAIAAGAATGFGLGHDALAALMTRGLREMTILATSMGARPQTMTGLAGMGDLVLTCTGGPSRNRRLGEMLAQGSTLKEAQAILGEVSEGVETVERALAEASARGLDMPIMECVRDLLFGGAPVDDVVERLMGRDLRDEMPE